MLPQLQVTVQARHTYALQQYLHASAICMQHARSHMHKKTCAGGASDTSDRSPLQSSRSSPQPASRSPASTAMATGALSRQTPRAGPRFGTSSTCWTTHCSTCSRSRSPGGRGSVQGRRCSCAAHPWAAPWCACAACTDANDGDVSLLQRRVHVTTDVEPFAHRIFISVVLWRDARGLWCAAWTM